MLHYNTVNEVLKESLLKLMGSKEFETFRLVGGTALSLQIGHRLSVDIDLFSDAIYGSIDFQALKQYLIDNFSFVDFFSLDNPALGMSFTIGTDKENSIKLDVYYTDTFIQPALIEDGIRLATVEEIIAMKIDVVQRGGRKKDFWDLHELLPKYSINKMLELHQERYPYTHDNGLIKQNLTDFSIADDDLEPVCLRGKYWAFIKEDIEDAVTSSKP
jgi:predicted nucleotidyltransferase component of viral defense system